ncbi:MAG: glycosyltransferase family 2 protein [Bacteroidetes bacterium]|nr:MAG: glycosyltransferase family 2 protein [Bacteroidota bacterium]
MVSIIVPIYNRCLLVPETIASVQHQTFKNYECILVDDGSTDDSVAVARKLIAQDSRFSLHERPSHIPNGGCGARNFGASLAKFDWLIFLDSDDLLSPNCLEYRLQLAATQPKQDFYVTHTALFSKKLGDTHLLWNLLNKPNLPDLMRFASLDTPWSPNAVLWRKAFFNSIGGWNETLKCWQDWELHIRAIVNAGSYAKDPHTVADNYYRTGTNAIKISGNNRSAAYRTKAFAAVVAAEPMFHAADSATFMEFQIMLRRYFIFQPYKNGEKSTPWTVLKHKPFLKHVSKRRFFYWFCLAVIMQNKYMKTLLTQVLKLAPATKHSFSPTTLTTPIPISNV